MSLGGDDRQNALRLSLVEWLTVLLSGIAIVLSGLSYLESRRAADVAELAFRAPENVVWRISAKDDRYIFADQDERVVGQEIVVVTPKNIGGDEWSVMNSDRAYPLSRVATDLENELTAYVKPENGTEKVGTLALPVVVRSYFVVNGRALEDRSLYFLNMIFSVGEGLGGVKLTPTSGLFSARLTSEQPDEEVLDQAWRQVAAAVFVAQFEGK